MSHPLDEHMSEILRIVRGDYKSVPAELFIKVLNLVELTAAQKGKIQTMEEMGNFKRPSGRKKTEKTSGENTPGV